MLVYAIRSACFVIKPIYTVLEQPVLCYQSLCSTLAASPVTDFILDLEQYYRRKVLSPVTIATPLISPTSSIKPQQQADMDTIL